MGGAIDGRLVIMRHSHAVGQGPGFADHDRPLTLHGAEVAAARHADIAPLEPDLVVCSSARRAVETMEGLALDGVPTVIEPLLYRAGPEGVIQLLSELDDDIGTALVIGHLPTVEITARVLVGRADVGSFRPASAAVMSRRVPWREISFGSCELEQFHS